MPLLHLDHPHTPGTPPDRCRAAPARSIHKIALMNSLAALRTDIVSPVKSNSLLANQRNAEMWSPSSHASTNSTPFMTPRSSLSPVHSAGLGGVAILEHISVLPETEPTAGELIPKSIDPLTFRSLFNSISTEGDVLLVSDPQYIQEHLPRPTVITSGMLAAEIIPLLVNSGCPDVTHKLDLDQCGTDPVAGGGFGDIFQGGLVGGVKVAIKRPRLFLKNDEQGKRVLKNVAREIYAWSKLEHPNVLELIGFSTFRGRISTVSAWMENGTLPEYISKYPSVDRFELCRQVSARLAYLHRSETIHGDVKGSNVLVSESGVAKLADFGNTVIKKLHTLSFTDSTGRRGISARWTAPELFEDGEQLSREADIYALGMTFLETVTGKVPFPASISERAVLANIIRGKTPERPNELSMMEKNEGNALWRVMSRCWSHTVANRPTASEIEQQLEKATRQPFVHELPTPTGAPIVALWWLSGIFGYLMPLEGGRPG